MDSWWQSAPVPAVRVWDDDPAPRWSANAAALHWAQQHGVEADDWQALARSGLVQGAWPGTADTTVRLGAAELPLQCRAVPMPGGALLWLSPPAGGPAGGDADVLRQLTPGQAGDTSEFLARALVLADVSVWRVDLTTRRVHYNLRGYRQMGMAPTVEGVDLDTVRDTIHPDDREGVMRAARQALDSDRVIDVIARYRNPDGSWRSLLTRRVAYRDASGRPLALAGVSLDLSDLVSEREHVLRLRERMDLVARAVGLGIWTRDVESGVAEWNEQMYRMHHRAPSEGPPTLAEWLQRHVHPLDRERMAREQHDADSQWTPVYQTEFRIPAPDGEVRWIYSWSRRELRMGRQMAFGVHIDITDRRSAEQELQRERARAKFAMDAAGMGVWERSLEGRPMYWSERMYLLRGLDPSDPRPLETLAAATMAAEDRQLLRRLTERHVTEGVPYEHEVQVRWPDGSRHWLVTRGQVVRDAAGQPLMMAGVNWDITERKLAERALREQQRAQQASRAKSEFMARMSHELRTPLNAVLGFAQLLADDTQQPPTPRQRERLNRIRSAGAHLLSLIDDVLDLSRIEADPRPPAREPVVLDEVCRESMHWLAEQAARRGVALGAETEPLPGEVWAARRELGQIVTNLLSNAIKYNREGGWVRLASTEEAVEGVAGWRLSVRDSGRGLTPEQLRRLFDPFERLGAELDGIEGTGIGLTIVHQLVERLQGRLTVDSEPGVGSEFGVWLPSAQAMKPAADAAAPAAAGALKLLCIEDNPVNMMLVREMLALRPAIEVRGAETGAEGIRIAQDWRPDVVLLDLQLPDLHGAEVLRQLRAESQLAGARIVALSANAMPQDMQAALAQGFDDYWTKPIELQAFLQRIDALAARG